jgi:hypothetical protein
MTDPLRIRIRSDWDAALTYDSLDEAPEARAVFVGRETLIAPLVAEIVEPNKRGTYLISGYRGTGKTTLLIEALSRAQKRLPKGYRLFPLVLNVSEVSASLGNATTAAERLDIDPRRLLIALLRTIAHRISSMAEKDSSLEPLVEQAHNAYEKATAAKFAQTRTRAQESTRTRSREFALALEDKNVLKTLAWAAGAAAVGFEAAALVGPTLGWLHGAALALAVAFGVSLTASYRRSSSEQQKSGNQTAVEHDNSLQQLETDLKDILTTLKQNKLRTVVVMEELDKLDDPGGLQLAAVIRYFKNLFTQAPALFFFVTDKSYFDIVASAIKRARRGRSYAVEHTFFTHRLFVGRATTEESLQFISAVAQDESVRNALKEVAETLGKPGRIDEADRLGRFVRVVLFSAANHLFDLKNELRRFVRNEEAQHNGQRVSSFLIDDQTLPPEEAALAVFQDLIVEKTRSFEIKGGRTYANETLADSLYAVFNELGSNRPQDVASFMPLSNEDPDQGLLLDEQLDLNEAARVREAVHSLIGDLERGRALTRNPTGDSFTWRTDAARAFRYVRQLEKHEESLVAELQRYSALAAPLIPLLEPVLGFEPQSLDLEKRLSEVREAREPMSADAAAEELRGVLDRYGVRLNIVFDRLMQELTGFGFILDPVAAGLVGLLSFVKPNSGDPRLTPVHPKGGVLIAFGENETLVNDVWSFMRPEATETLRPLDRAALVHVVHVTGNIEVEIENRLKQWQKELAERAGPKSEFRYSVDVVALVDPDRDPNLNTQQQIAAVLAGFGAWSRPEVRAIEPLPQETPPLTEAIKDWIESDVQLLQIVLPPQGNTSRFFYERDSFEQAGRVLLSLSGVLKTGGESLFARVAGTCLLNGFDQSVTSPDLRDLIGRWLLSEERVILFALSGFSGQWTGADIAEALEAGARVIFATPEPLPAELQAFSTTTFPPP